MKEMMECLSYSYSEKKYHFDFSELVGFVQIPLHESLKIINEIFKSSNTDLLDTQYEVACLNFIYLSSKNNKGESKEIIQQVWEEFLKLGIECIIISNKLLLISWFLDIMSTLSEEHLLKEIINQNRKFAKRIDEFFDGFCKCFGLIVSTVNSLKPLQLLDFMEPPSIYDKKKSSKEPVAIYFYLIYKKLYSIIELIVSKYKRKEIVIYKI